MATYIMLSTLTDEGRKTLKERPERLQEVNKELETMGARVTHQFAVLGGYDFVNVFTSVHACAARAEVKRHAPGLDGCGLRAARCAKPRPQARQAARRRFGRLAITDNAEGLLMALARRLRSSESQV
jgi:uncharacterized protein with GYD domain